MLVGSYTYQGVTFGIRGYDFGDNIALYLNCPTTQSRKMVDSGIHDSEGELLRDVRWDDLYLSIGAGNISADCYIEMDGDTKCKNELNRDLITSLGNVIRGMKSGCNKTRQDKDGALFDIGFNPMKVIKYEFDNGYVELDLKVIKKLKYNNTITGVSVELEEDGSYAEKVWRMTNALHKFKLDLSEFIEVVDEDDWDFSEGDDKIFSLAEIIEKNPDKSYAWLKGRKYYIVKSIEEVEKVCKYIWSFKRVAFDTETTGLRVNITSRVGAGDRLVGMVFSVEPGIAYYFPIAHKKIKNICTPGNEAFIIEKYFKPILEKKDILCHNGAYDWKVMYNYGICINLTDDTYILFKVTMWNDHRNLKLGLKDLTSTFLGRDSFTLSDFVRGKFDSEHVKFWDLEEESVKYYACPDTDNLIELYEYAMNEKLLDKYDAKKIYEIEVLFSIVIAYQEYYGHCVDISKIDDLVASIKRDKEESYNAMVKIAGHDFNPASSPQLIKIMFEELGMPIVERTDTGNPSAGKEARKKLGAMTNDDGSPKYPFIGYLGRWKDASTLESNFTNNIDKYATEDGLIFSEVQQFLETGRVSSKNPNYQGYSDTVKKYIVPRNGFYAMDADYSSVEARIMCSMAGCKEMVEKLKDPDADYHRLKASDMFGVPYELVSDKLRKMSKGVNFGILYGLGDPNLGVNLYGYKSPENTRKAKRQKKLYFKGMEGLENFIEVSKEQGVNQNFSTTFFKRRRYYDPRKVRRDKIERQSCNARIQGTAADIYKLAMVRLFLQIKNKGLLGKVLISAFVHDECFLEVHKSVDPCKMLSMLRKCMMLEMEGWCPLFIGAGYGRNWYEAKKTEIPVQVQQMFVDTYGESGLDWWNGDVDKLCKWVVNHIMTYKRDRVINYLKNKDNWGKVLNPAENELAHSLLKDIQNGQEVEGAVTNDCSPSKDVLENLQEFCRVFNCMELYENANIQKPVETSSSIDNTSDEELQKEEDIDPHKVLLMRVNMVGVHSSKTSEGRKIYFKYSDKDKVLMSLIHKTIKNNPGDVEVIAIKDDGCEYLTGMTCSIKAYPKLLQLYVNRANIG